MVSWLPLAHFGIPPIKGREPLQSTADGKSKLNRLLNDPISIGHLAFVDRQNQIGISIFLLLYFNVTSPTVNEVTIPEAQKSSRHRRCWM